MHRICIAFILSLIMSAAKASGYEDFTRAISALNAQAYDQAIALFSSAIAAGDLSESELPVAYLDRANAYFAKQACEKAVQDYSAALKLKPNYLQALMGQANANVCLNKLDAAIANATQAISLQAGATQYFARARFRYLSGDYSGAVTDLRQAMTSRPDDPYLAIWLWLAESHMPDFDVVRFRSEISNLRVDDWPSPILDFLEGNGSPDDALAKAKQDGLKWKQCEADYYVAEWQLVWQKPDAAKPLLQDAVGICPQQFVELEAARIELARLK